MKKKLNLIALILCLLLTSVGCKLASTASEQVSQDTQDGKTQTISLRVGATPVPHAELLKLIKEDLILQHIELEIVEFTDYIKPNLALNDGEIDANFFQHLPYLERFSSEHDLDLEAVASIHVEPLGYYSEKIQDIRDLKEASLIAIPSDAVNGGRALILLQSQGLITLKEGYTLEATEQDIVDNPKQLKFKAIEAAQLPRILADVDGAIINGNFALEAGLIPTEDALLLEGSESPYVNILVTRSTNKEDDAIQALVTALQSEKIKTYISNTYKGGVVPVFE